MSEQPTTATTAAGPLAALFGLEQQLRAASDLAQLSYTIVNQTQACVPYTQCVLLLGADPASLRVVAASDIGSVDHTSPYVVWIERLVRERAALAAGAPDALPAQGVAVPTTGPAPVQAVLQPDDLPEALREPWREMAPGHLLWQPLTVQARGGESNGLLLLFHDKAWSPAELGLSAHLAASMGHALFALRRLDPVRQLRRLLHNRRATLGALLGTVVVLAFPLRLSALAPVEVIAQDPLVISAPMDGAVREIKVLPNQTVTKGQVLAVMEDAELSSALEVARRDLSVAQAELRTSQHGGFQDPSQKADLAELEAKVRVRQAQLEHAQGRLDRATVRALDAGVAVLGDPDEWKGRPVRVGERILLVARPDKVNLQVMLAVKDSIALVEGAELKVFFDNNPLDARDATLRHAAYEPQRTPEDTLAYRLVANLPADDAEPLPRIGMRGTVRVYGERVSLFFYLFRRPITSLRQWLGW